MKEVLEGLQILIKYDDGDVCAEHDEIFAGHNADPMRMTAEERTQLEGLGWTWDEDLPSWHKFV